ncbi:MAG: alpha/beta fold hydrolase [Rhodococcus sp. (in: high G+C Gram-positive bacteria)]|uniref:lipase family protein n=1 Tax=Rhodococcus sp. TaxID=1831 RepID=UPI003BB77CC5
MISGIAVTAAILTGCSATDNSSDTSTPQPGDLLSTAPLTTAAALPGAARNELITYSSVNDAGRPIVVSGTVAIPPGTAPDGGWPVISWGHGTTGIADTCAPSGDTVDGAAHDYLARTIASLDRWLDQGYAVVRTDYEGMGTPGDHTYLNARSEVNAMTDIVTAARNLDDSVGTTWIAVGHSQGGAAAISASELGVERAEGLDLAGVIALAPGSGLSQTPLYITSGDQSVAPVLGFLPLTLLGAAAADPAVVPDDIVTPAADPLMKAARTGCIADVRAAIGDIRVDSVIRPDADLGPWTDYLKEQEPENTTPAAPVLILQGTADTVVAAPTTDILTATLCGKGAPVVYETVDGADHRDIMDASFDTATAFAADVVAGTEIAPSCP